MSYHLLTKERSRTQDRRQQNGAMTAIFIVSLALLLPGCISASAPKTAANMNGEGMYAPQPWANSKPVNITARVSAIQGALSAVQTASNSYVDYQTARADTHNRRQARLAAYESHKYHERLRTEDERLKAIRERDAASPSVISVKPRSIELGPSPTMADYADDIGNSMRGFAKSMRGWIAAGHPAFEYSTDYKAPAWQPRVTTKRN